MRLITLSTILTFLLIGCGDDSTPQSGAGGTDANFTTLTHKFDPLFLDVADEISGVCQTWVLDNDEPLYVQNVRQANDGGWHHSNWFFVPEDAYEPNPTAEGPDATVEGTWQCRDRHFREYLAAAAGGVFFAQSTQALAEQQHFPAGTALEIPPRSMIVGSVHLLNFTASSLDSAFTMEVDTVPREDVSIRLTPFSFSNTSLDIAPQRESRFSMTCDLTEVFQTNLDVAEPDYNIYYVLAHYHEWGNYFNLSFEHDDGSRETILELENRVGEPIGKTIDPPINNNGTSKLTLECGYLNNTDRTLAYGLGGQEMCVFLAYTDSNLKVGASGGTNHKMGEDESGMLLNETECGDPITGFKAYDDEL
jgi:hypothetical protein